MTFTFLACSITGAKPTSQTLTILASRLYANTMGQDYSSCCGGGETEAQSKELIGLSLPRGTHFALTIRPHPVPVWTSVGFHGSHLWSKTWGFLAGGVQQDGP